MRFLRCVSTVLRLMNRVLLMARLEKLAPDPTKTLTKKCTFVELLAPDKFIASAELTPPWHSDTTKFMEAAGVVSEYVDLVQPNDHLLSRVRPSDLVAGMHCKNAGLKLILQSTLCLPPYHPVGDPAGLR